MKERPCPERNTGVPALPSESRLQEKFTDENYWNSRAEDYAADRRISDVDIQVVGLSAIRDEARLLEIGCGPGTFAEYLVTSVREFRVEYVGMDTSRSFAELSRQRLAKCGQRTHILRASVTEMPFQPSSFHVAYAITVLHHLPIEQIRTALSSTRDCLKPGGQFLIVEDWAFVPASDFEAAAVALRKRLMDYERVVENHLPTSDWQTLIEEAGFGIRSVRWSSRPFSWKRYTVLNDEHSRQLLPIVQRTSPEHQKVPMAIFDCSLN